MLLSPQRDEDAAESIMLFIPGHVALHCSDRAEQQHLSISIHEVFERGASKLVKEHIL